MITVFTPAYNRAHLLGRLYESLVAQTCQDFEWIVVDDGSTDDTRTVVAGFITEGKLNIRYYHQENGGKHRAINRGVKEARGELFFIVDSDDYLLPSSISLLLDNYTPIQNDLSFSGVSGRKAFHDMSLIGKQLDFEMIDCTFFHFKHKLGVTADVAEAYRTDVMKKYPFPDFENEKFCPEAYVWYEIAKAGYKLRFFNKAIVICEYLSDGLTANITKLRVKSPLASVLTYYELWSSQTIMSKRIKGAINYWRFFFHCPIEKRPDKKVSKIFKLLGYILFLKDKKQIQQ